ncbi:MAG: T9SS type A sorting domain-containing protein [Candidatus Kapabacteria bacterium]|nr:T9SS type A sorting domain-containing protein [Candidatus Kapabacteria bacterium]
MIAQNEKELFPEQLLSSCCEEIDIDYYVTEDCCIQIDIDNPSCEDAKISILSKAPNSPLWNLRYVESAPATSVSYKLCPSNYSTSMRFRIIIQHANGAPHCDTSLMVEGVNQFTYDVDISHCCNCEGSSSWITSYKSSDTLCPDSCSFGVYLNIPDSITCFKYYGTWIAESGNAAKDIDSVSNIIKCVGPGEESSIRIRLLTSMEEYHSASGCYLSAQISCDTTTYFWMPDIDLTCWDDCEEAEVRKDTLSDFHVPGCFNCPVTVSYVTRKCNDKQELQITGFWTHNTWNCRNCPDEMLYDAALKEIIYKNKMEFEPTEVNDCDTTWRVGISSCFGTYIYTNWIMKWEEAGPSGPGGWVSVLDTIVVRVVCDTIDCCFKQLTVCRYDDHITIADGASSDTNIICLPPLQFPMLEPPVFCGPSCDWLDSLEGYYYPHLSSKESYGAKFFLYEEIKVNSYIQNGKFNLEIESPNSSEIKFTVYDYLGNIFIQSPIRIQAGTTRYNIDLTPLNTGTYIYTIVFDENLIKTDKFIYIK